MTISVRGVIFGSRLPRYGVNFARRFTVSDPEARPFPHWSMEEMRTKKGTVDMYRLLYGVMAAQWLCPQLGFPTPPVELVENGRQMTMILVPQMDAAE